MSEAEATLRAAAGVVEALGMLAHNIVQLSERQVEPFSTKDFDVIVVEMGCKIKALQAEAEFARVAGHRPAAAK